MSDGREVSITEDAEFTARSRAASASSDAMRKSGYYGERPNTASQDHRSAYDSVRYDRYVIDVLADDRLVPVLSSSTRSPFRLQVCSCVAQCVDLATRGGTFEREFIGYTRYERGHNVSTSYDSTRCNDYSAEHRRFHHDLKRRYESFGSPLPKLFLSNERAH